MYNQESVFIRNNKVRNANNNQNKIVTITSAFIKFKLHIMLHKFNKAKNL